MNKNAYVVRDQLKRATHTRAGATISAATRAALDEALDALDDAQIGIDLALQRITDLIDLPAEDDAASEERAARRRGYELVDAESDGGPRVLPGGYHLTKTSGTPAERQGSGAFQVVRRADSQPGSPGFTLVDGE